MPPVPLRQIRANYDARTIRVYQAYSNAIADSALARGNFVSPPFSMTRMTWIKPSFLWMMYRAGYGFKDAGQARILAIDMTREGFEWALAHACLSHPGPGMSREKWMLWKARSPVRVQWDPERDLQHQPLSYRAIQIGLSGPAVRLYITEWIRSITDITEQAHAVHAQVRAGRLQDAHALLPEERPYAFVNAQAEQVSRRLF
ncbi:MAG: DUF4291 domain-containing protein [Xanthomonadaceae bacterium]|nr:DUF4291 domain-containing protein [Xanthomonadaceae bacterium]